MTEAGQAGTVMTVLGPIPAGDLGVTLPHEHVLIDLTCLWQPPAFDWQEPLADAIPSLQNRADLSLDPYVSRANLRLDDSDVAVAELQLFQAQGGSAVIDLTVQGIGPQPEALRSISRRTGVHLIMGCGHYIQRAHVPAVGESGEEQLAEDFIRQIRDGFGTTGVRPGIIGEIGTSADIHPDEVRVLRAAARAQRATGLAINVHVAIFARQAERALDSLETAGADLERVVISHLDELLDLDYHRAVLRRGAYAEFDTFGSEFSFDGEDRREPRDADRIETLLRLLDEGWSERLLLSQDVCTKTHLRRYGGFGYGHLLRTIVPRLRRRGVDDQLLHTMLVANPARLLSVPS